MRKQSQKMQGLWMSRLILQDRAIGVLGFAAPACFMLIESGRNRGANLHYQAFVDGGVLDIGDRRIIGILKAATRYFVPVVKIIYRQNAMISMPPTG